MDEEAEEAERLLRRSTFESHAPLFPPKQLPAPSTPLPQQRAHQPDHVQHQPRQEQERQPQQQEMQRIPLPGEPWPPTPVFGSCP